MRDQGCVQESIRMTPDLARLVPSVPVTVKFTIEPTGGVSRFEAMTLEVSPRVLQAIEEAVRRCRWLPGRNPAGETVPIWVILPIRFAPYVTPAMSTTSSAIDGLTHPPPPPFSR
jgi:hypothetical protein